jgi:cell wall assembly regulator SMI1
MLVKELLYTIEGLLNKYTMEYKNLEGVTNDHLQSFEKNCEIKLPEDFKEYYTLKNGSRNLDILHIIIQRDSYASFRIVSLGDIRKIKMAIYENDEKMNEEYYKNSKIDNRIKPYISNKQWLPFAETESGSMHLMLDFDPSEKGIFGQILCCVPEVKYVYYIAPTFTKLLEDTIENLRSIGIHRKK